MKYNFEDVITIKGRKFDVFAKGDDVDDFTLTVHDAEVAGDELEETDIPEHWKGINIHVLEDFLEQREEASENRREGEQNDYN